MTNLMKRLGSVFLAVFVACSGMLAFGVPAKAEASDPFIVYLQAGHSPASMGNGNVQGNVKESTLNEQLTKMTYNALKAKGVQVMLLNPITLDATLPSLIKTQPGLKGQYAYYSPEPAMLTALANPEKFDSSITRQGDLVVCLHHNAYANSSIRGYEVYYANTQGGDYGRTAEDAKNSKAAAEAISASLQKGSFGVPPRAPVVRQNNSNNGITKYSPVPSVLLEMGYMTNSSDMAAIKTASNHEKMAAQIADGIVNYAETVGTTADDVPAVKSFTVTPTMAQTPAFVLNATFNSSDDISAVRAAVWTLASDKEDMKWYPLTKNSSGAYTANVSTADFGGADGTYAFHLYVADKSGQTTCVAQSYEKPPETGNEPEATPTPSTTPSPSPTPVPSAKPDSGSTANSVSVTVDRANPHSATVLAKGVSDPDGVSAVKFAVWSVQGGQDDLKWFDAKKSGSDWSAAIRTSDMAGRSGVYMVHAYATDKLSNQELIGAASATLGDRDPNADSKPPVMEGSFTYNLVTQSQLRLQVTNVTDPSGVSGVRFAFWGKEDQSDLVWYNGENSGSSWTANVDLTKHSGDKYNVHVYSTDDLGNDGIISNSVLSFGGDVEGPSADAVRAAMIQGGVNLATLTAENVVDNDSGVKEVRFAVWTQKDGQDDLVWYDAEPVRNSTDWDISITAKKHKNEPGPYEVHAYGWDNAGNSRLMGATYFTFDSNDKTPPTASGVTSNEVIYTQPTAQITVKDVKDAESVVTGVRIAVYSEANGTKDLTWFTAKKDENGLDWTASFDWSEHFNTVGVFYIEAHAYDSAGNDGIVGKLEVEVAQDSLGGVPIMGKSQATKAQLVNYLLRNEWDNEWYDMTVDQFVQIYLDVCAAENVRVEVAVAQMVHETGNLKYGNLVERDMYNFAGLGATNGFVEASKRKPHYRYTEDGREMGIVFKTVEDGIKSHVQHLKSYASKEPLVLPMAPEYDRYDYIVHGSAPTVEALGGKWATGSPYAMKVLLFVEGILNESNTMPSIPPYTPSGSGAGTQLPSTGGIN